MTTTTLDAVTQNGRAVARPPGALVPLIKDELANIDAAGMEHKRRAGELLIEAKEGLNRGEWGPWLMRNFHLSHYTATTYMRLARESENGGRAPFSSLKEMRAPDRPQAGSAPRRNSRAR